jgi:hypothetical protein
MRPMSTAPERAHDYHANGELRLSSTIAKALVMRTPAHAKAILDGQVTFESDAMTLGTAVHQLLLRDDRVTVLEYDSYRSKDAQLERDLIRSAGRVPILRAKFDEAREIAQCCNGQIIASGVEPLPFTKGKAEHVVRWSEDGVDCRALLDWVRDDASFIDDLKTTNDASPAKFQRHIFNMGYDIQAAFYLRAVKSDGWDEDYEPTFRWVVVETKPPYPVTIYQLDDAAMHAAQVKVDLALQLWKQCLETGEWPGYPTGPHIVTTPGWATDREDLWAEVDVDEVPF